MPVYVDLVEGVSIARGDRRLDGHLQPRGRRLADVEPRGGDLTSSLVIRDCRRQAAEAAARQRMPATRLSVDAVISRRDRRQEVHAGDVLARIPLRGRQDPRHHGRSAARGRAVRGPPVRRTAAIICGDRRHASRFGKDYKNKRRITDRAGRRGCRAGRVPDPQGQAHRHLQDGDDVEKRRSSSIDGNPAPHDILAMQGRGGACRLPRQRDPGGLSAAGRRRSTTSTSRSIVRQMLQKVEITDPGDTDLILSGDQVDKHEFDDGRTPSSRSPTTRTSVRPPARPGAARHHQGVPADAVVHLGRLLPGDDARAHRGGRQRQVGHAARASRRTSSSAASSRPAPAP